ncbi:UNVERIFIED_CONTAM: Epoxide hydrolase A [Sesamum radiatum]|uniref:Epoxide hydrolase A n=1 Tax=Sesamum radiatum TaxID=300843 RepID=A0AAW2T1K4_SESRA
MDKIEHKYVEVNGLKLHVAEFGSGSSPAVVFLHGFPEIWYSWRHQMLAVAEAGFRAIAPDYRGYGLSDPPPEPEKASFLDFVDDLLALLDALALSKVFLIGKVFGAAVVSIFTLLHRERVLGFVTMGVPFMPPRPPSHHQHLPEGFYISRWKEPGRAEADFGRLDAKTVVRNVYIMFSKSEVPIAQENQEIMDLVEPSAPLPPWFSEEDLAVYGALYEKSGFRTALQEPGRAEADFGRFDAKTVVRNVYIMFSKSEVPIAQENQEIMDLVEPSAPLPPWFTEEDLAVYGALYEKSGQWVQSWIYRILRIMGEKDYILKFPGIKDYIRNETVKSFVPNLEITFMLEGGHFVQEQSPDEVNELVLKFLRSHH